MRENRLVGFLWVNAVSWGNAIPILISIAALAVAIWTKVSEGRFRKEAEKARRSADIVASAGGSTWEPETSRRPRDEIYDGTHGSTVYTLRLHNAGQMSAGDIMLWAELEDGKAASDESYVGQLLPDGRTETTLRTEHRMQTPLLLRARWTDGNGSRTRNLMILDPFS